MSNTTCRTAPAREVPRRRADLAEIFPEGATYTSMSMAQHPSTGTRYDVFEEWMRNVGGVSQNQRWAAGDFDFDGDQDLMAIWEQGGNVRMTLWRSTGGSFVYSHWGNAPQMGPWRSSAQWLPGDFNGDGKTDLAQAWQDGVYTTVTVYLSTGTSLAPGDSNWGFHNGGWAYPARWSVGDFNNDGRDDILTAWKEGSSTTLTVRWTMPGTSTFIAQAWRSQAWPWNDNTAWIAGNFDGAAGTDVVAIENASGSSAFAVFRSNLSTFGAGSTWQTSGGWAPESLMRWQVSDVDADGDDDITAIWNDSAMSTFAVRLATITSKGARTLAAPVPWAVRRTTWQAATVWCAGSFDRN